MQFLTTLLSALALAASTTTASPIAAPAPDSAAIAARSELLVFSPYLIHGGGVNFQGTVTRASLEARFWRA